MLWTSEEAHCPHRTAVDLMRRSGAADVGRVRGIRLVVQCCVSLPTLGRDSCFEVFCRPHIRAFMLIDHDGRRPFLLPSANAWRRKALDLVSDTGDLGLSFPDWLLDESDDDDWEADRSRPSRRMSSRETLRSGRVYVGASVGSRISWNFEGMVANVVDTTVERVGSRLDIGIRMGRPDMYVFHDGNPQ
jgi:hypothetical protein